MGDPMELITLILMKNLEKIRIIDWIKLGALCAMYSYGVSHIPEKLKGASQEDMEEIYSTHTPGAVAWFAGEILKELSNPS